MRKKLGEMLQLIVYINYKDFQPNLNRSHNPSVMTLKHTTSFVTIKVLSIAQSI